jgi:hypothetical protein
MWATAPAPGGLRALGGSLNQAEVCMSFVSITFENAGIGSRSLALCGLFERKLGRYMVL